MRSLPFWIRGAAVTAIAGISLLSPEARGAPDGSHRRQGRHFQGPLQDLIPGDGPVQHRARSTDAGLEPQPLFDEPFGDALSYQQTIERFIERTAQMRRLCDDFGRAVQETLAALGAARVVAPEAARRSCPQQVHGPYSRAHGLGQDYLRVGRELARHHATVRELDRLGDSAGLTPDYRVKVKQVLRTYETMLVDYREMKAAFHDQLSDELRFVGCDTAGLLALGPEVEPDPEGLLQGDEPQPVRPPSPEQRTAIRFYVDNSRCKRGHQVFLDGQALGEVQGSARAAFQSSAGPHEICLLAEAAPQGEARPAPVVPVALNAALALQRAEAAERSVVQAGQRCGAPGTVRRSYLHDGWTIALRCE